MDTPKRPRYVLQERNGYKAIDLYIGDVMNDTELVLHRTSKETALSILYALNSAVSRGIEHGRNGGH